MDRRTLLRLLLASPIAATVDVEQLLWTPKPLIVVPARGALTLEMINQAAEEAYLRCLPDAFYQSMPLLNYLKAQGRLNGGGGPPIQANLLYQPAAQWPG